MNHLNERRPKKYNLTYNFSLERTVTTVFFPSLEIKQNHISVAFFISVGSPMKYN